MFRTFSHIVLILLLLCTTAGMTINLHYCDDNLYDIGLFTDAANCCMDSKKMSDEKTHNHSACDSNMPKTMDCEDETVHIESVDDFLVSPYSFNFNQDPGITLFLLCFVSATLPDFADICSDHKIPKFHSSPPRIEEVLSFKQAYLL